MVPTHCPFEVSIKCEHVSQAIKCAKNTAPGPDGLPYAAYDGGPLIEGLLRDATHSLTFEVADTLDDFNAAYLACLPKKPERTDNGLDIFKPKGTRPSP